VTETETGVFIFGLGHGLGHGLEKSEAQFEISLLSNLLVI
jgi:hypothetical protein